MARILVVEDDKLTAAALAFFLRDLGHDVHRAGTLHEALSAASERPFDLLVSDMQLPDGHGEELVTKLDLPAIALTGFALDSVSDRFALRLEKPVDLDALESGVKQVLSARGL